MDFLQRYLLQARAFLGDLAPTTRWLIGCLLVILVLTGGLMMQYVGKADRVPITQFAAGRQAEVIARLERSGIAVNSEGGQVLVSSDQYNEAMVLLVSGELLAADTTAAFDEMIARQSPWQSNAQNAQVFLLAKQKVLGQIISKMAHVRSASVMLSMPSRQGFGATHISPSASVNVVMNSRHRVEKPLVEAIAGLVSGALAEMQPGDVVVVDANRGRRHTVNTGGEPMPGETLEIVQQLEQRYRHKITEALSYIPGLIVAVNVRVDPVHSKRIEEFNYETSEPLRSEFSRETERRNATNGGEPGVRSNTGLDISGGGSSGNSESSVESRSEFGEKSLTRRAHITEVGHNTQRINVTVNVPRSYFVGVFKQDKAEDTEDPDDGTLQPIVAAQLAQIKAQVDPLVGSAEGEGTVEVHMVPDPGRMLALTGLGSASGAPGGMAMVLDSGWIKPVGLGMLAMLSLGIMFGMVRKATRQPMLPSVEELSGVPPILQHEESFIGEVDESDASMDGRELDEDEVHMRKITQEIGDMIRNDPVEAKTLLKRWVKTEE